MSVFIVFFFWFCNVFWFRLKREGEEQKKNWWLSVKTWAFIWSLVMLIEKPSRLSDEEEIWAHLLLQKKWLQKQCNSHVSNSLLLCFFFARKVFRPNLKSCLSCGCTSRATLATYMCLRNESGQVVELNNEIPHIWLIVCQWCSWLPGNERGLPLIHLFNCFSKWFNTCNTKCWYAGHLIWL